MSRIWSSAAILTILAAPAGSAADVTLVETTHATSGGRTFDGVRTTYIKGDRMRVETVQEEQVTTTLYDLPADSTIALDLKKRRAELRSISARDAELERQYPRARTTVSLTPTGTVKTCLGARCNEHTFTIRVPMTKDGDVTLVMSGSAWVGIDAQAADDYAAFAKAAIGRHLVLGPASNNRILLAFTRAQTELYRALAGLRGIPYNVDFSTSVDGHGVLAGLIRKALTATRTSTVTTLSAAPLSDTMFAIPEGWKREKK